MTRGEVGESWFMSPSPRDWDLEGGEAPGPAGGRRQDAGFCPAGRPLPGGPAASPAGSESKEKTLTFSQQRFSLKDRPVGGTDKQRSRGSRWRVTVRLPGSRAFPEEGNGKGASGASSGSVALLQRERQGAASRAGVCRAAAGGRTARLWKTPSPLVPPLRRPRG